MTRRLESVLSRLKKKIVLISSCHRFEYNVKVMSHRKPNQYRTYSRRNRAYRPTISSSYVSLSFGLVDDITFGDSVVIGKIIWKNTKNTCS